jgi:hypothetical protein
LGNNLLAHDTALRNVDTVEELTDILVADEGGLVNLSGCLGRGKQSAEGLGVWFERTL